MRKRFNITGNCKPSLHYMMDNSKKMANIMDMVEFGEYFTINRPRQYGKTTSLQFITQTLKENPDYIPLRMNFQGVDEKWHISDEAFAVMFMTMLFDKIVYTYPNLKDFLAEEQAKVIDMNSLSRAITTIVHQLKKKVVLLIDEVDASSNYTAFLSFLAMLRTKYLERDEPWHATFHSIILAGVHDIKNLKYKKPHSKKTEYNSPWNIAADFKIRMSFNVEEIIPMLKDYSASEKVKMDFSAIAEQLYYQTSGYPFLVSKLCKIIAEDIIPQKQEKEWSLEDVELAIQMILKENNTNFDSLIKNLENHPDLYDLVYKIIILGDTIPSNPDEPIISRGRMYGIFKLNGSVKIHNRIYEQRIYNYLSVKTLIRSSSLQNHAGQFLLDDNALDIKGVLLAFQQFMKEQYGEKNKNFIEHHGRILFLAYLTPILNGQGYAFREVQTSLEKRLDIIVTYFQHRYIIELKRWYGPKAHQKGLTQLADYLDIHGVGEGFLLIFDDRQKKTWASKLVKHQGKTIFAVWV